MVGFELDSLTLVVFSRNCVERAKKENIKNSSLSVLEENDEKNAFAAVAHSNVDRGNVHWSRKHN